MKRALIVLGLELAVLAVAVAAFSANERPAVQWPTAVARTAPVTPAVRSTVPVSISLSRPIGNVETAALTRGGMARTTRARGHVAVKVIAATAAGRRVRGP